MKNKKAVIIIIATIFILMVTAPWMNKQATHDRVFNEKAKIDGSINKQTGELICDYNVNWFPFGRFVSSCEGGYFVPFFYFKKENDDNVKKQTISENENKATETADWKTYKNEEYGFEFKYPKEYSISLPSSMMANESTGGFDTDPQQELLNKDILTFDYTKNISVWVYELASLPTESARGKDDPLQDTTQKDLIAQRAKIEKGKVSNEYSEPKGFTKNISKIIKISSKKAERSIYYSPQSGNFINTLDFFHKEGDLITIESYLLDAKTIEEAKKDPQTSIFDAIVSSFKFTD